MSHAHRFSILTAALVLLQLGGPASAQEAPAAGVPGPVAPTPYTPPQPAEPSKEPPVGATEEIPRPQPTRPSQPGYVINTAQGDTLIVGGYIHTDGRAFVGEGSSAYPDQLLLRQVRPVLEGTIRDRIDYRLLPDFAGGKVVVQEAFGDLRLARSFEIRVGKFKSPVGLERLQNSNAVVFAERAFPTNLAPNRDVGIQLFGDIGGVVTYQVGLFDGAIDNGATETDQDKDSNKEGAARLFLTPFARSGFGPLKGLGVGASGTWGAPRGTAASTQLPVFVSPGQNTIFSYLVGSTADTPDAAKTVVAAGDHLRWDVQGYYYWGFLGLQSEYIREIQRVSKGTTALRATNSAWAVTGSVVLTGEDATFRMIVPDRPLDPERGQWGAVEVAGRYQQIRFDPALFGSFADPAQSVSGANAWGVGVNWYLDRSFRVMLDYDRSRFFGGASSGGRVVDRIPEQALVGRAQVVF